MSSRVWLVRVLVPLFLLPAALADDLSAIQQRLANDYVGKTLVQRQFAKGSKVKYDSDGRLIHGGGIGPWTLYGFVHLTDLKVYPERLQCQGERLFLIYDSDSGKMYDYFAHTESAQFKATKQKAPDLKSFRQVEIDIALPANADEPTVRSTLERVFATRDKLGELVPGYWRRWVISPATALRAAATDATAPEEAGHAYTVKEGAKPPRVRWAPDPMYSDMAQKAKLQGVTVLTVVVSPQGLPVTIEISRPLGMGLDEEAVQAVQEWKFAPGTKDGQPVAVCINVEAQFRVY